MSKQELMPAVQIVTKNDQPEPVIKNYAQLRKRSIEIGKQYSDVQGSAKHLRACKTRLSRGSRGLNDTRKKYSRPVRKFLRKFKGKIDVLRQPLDNDKKNINKKLDEKNNQRLQEIHSHLIPIMHQVCAARHIKDVPVPKDALKLSLTKRKRLDLMVGTADQAVRKQTLDHSRAFHGKAISPNGEILPHMISRKITFFGDDEDLKKLLNFADKNNIHLNVSK